MADDGWLMADDGWLMADDGWLMADGGWLMADEHDELVLQSGCEPGALSA